MCLFDQKFIVVLVAHVYVYENAILMRTKIPSAKFKIEYSRSNIEEPRAYNWI